MADDWEDDDPANDYDRADEYDRDFEREEYDPAFDD
jgi:hypothetical protein